MNPLHIFQLLKTDVLLTYKKQHPYFEGNWKTFSSQDILNLIDLVETSTNQRVSEKWIYTHLKPQQNEKLPRKDMLDILSQFVGYSSWDEYSFKHKHDVIPSITKKVMPKFIFWIFGFCLVIAVAFYFYLNSGKYESTTIVIKNAQTNEKITGDEINAVLIENDIETPIEVVDSKIEIDVKGNRKVVLKSPYYNDKTIIASDKQSEIKMQPNDYAMMLKAFMKSDIKDWQTRKKQLQKILASDVEIIVILQENLGYEYFNKEEFSEKLIIPTASLKKMRVIDIQHNNNNEINFIRIIQE